MHFKAGKMIEPLKKKRKKRSQGGVLFARIKTRIDLNTGRIGDEKTGLRALNT